MSLMMTMVSMVQDGANQDVAKHAVDAVKDLVILLKDPTTKDVTEQSLDSITTLVTTHNYGLKQALAAIGAGLCIIGGGFGIGKLAASAMESISRQPEAAGDIRGGMILAAALIEGVTLLALITCILAIVL